jgi:uncharacterized protein with ParB-like and HNH nuclease domain
MELNAVTRSVNDIFSVSKKYLVPRFQRQYSWKQEEIQDFWNDIIQQISYTKMKIKHTEYFVGCMVLVGDDSKSDYLIVDGQQRLTTITILLRSIVRRLNELGDSLAAKALHKNVIEGIDDDGKPYFKLINETPKPYFQNEVQSLDHTGINTPQTDEEKLLSGAYDFFNKKLSGLKFGQFSELESVKAIRTQVLQYLKFILVTAKNEDDAYTIFETLNARGIGLTSVDLIKNWIFKNNKSTHPNDNAKFIWDSMRKTVSEFSDLETFFRHYWNSKYSFASNDRLYKSFSELHKIGKIAPAKEFLLELKSAAERYRKIAVPNLKDWGTQKEKSVFRYFELLNQYKVTQVRPFLLALIECRENKAIGETDFVTMIGNLENFHFIFSNICQSRASGLEGTYTRAAKKLYAAENDKAAAKEVLKKLSEYLIEKRPKKETITGAVAGLEFVNGNDGSKKTIQTIFSKIEVFLHGTSELTISSFSLEHIQDQSSNVEWVGGVGNLIPLDAMLNNGIGSGVSFLKKKASYKKSKLEIVKKFLEHNQQENWGKENATKWEKLISDLLDESTKIKNIK